MPCLSTGLRFRAIELFDLVLRGLVLKPLLTEDQAHPALPLLMCLEVEVECLARNQSDWIVFDFGAAFEDLLVYRMSVLETVSCIDLALVFRWSVNVLCLSFPEQDVALLNLDGELLESVLAGLQEAGARHQGCPRSDCGYDRGRVMSCDESSGRQVEIVLLDSHCRLALLLISAGLSAHLDVLIVQLDWHLHFTQVGNHV